MNKQLTLSLSSSEKLKNLQLSDELQAELCEYGFKQWGENKLYLAQVLPFAKKEMIFVEDDDSLIIKLLFEFLLSKDILKMKPAMLLLRRYF